jgi:serine/threonine-protein kinase
MSEPLDDRVVAAVGDHYELGGEIGRGGMSVVYSARDRRLNRPVAIKVLPPELAYDPAVRTRFMREAQTSAQLSHAHIVPIYDVGEREGLAYFVMALVAGGNLAAFLAQIPRPPIDDVRRLLREICDALTYAHQRGVVHRDIKPDNILLDAEGGRAVVTDFGIARAMEAGGRLTATGIAVGTPAYMSPEQAVGEREVDGRSDIYSLGVLGYQMLTGRVPFTGGNSMALLLKHITESPRPISELRPDAPRALCDAIDRALVKDREDRWPTAIAFRDALAAVDAGNVSWRSERREPVRYISPVPVLGKGARTARESPRSEARPAAPPLPPPMYDGGRAGNAVAVEPGSIVLEPGHLAHLTRAQREDLRLWHGRVNLLERVKAMRGYAWLTAAAVCGGIGALAGVPDVPPLILAPLVPAYMSWKLWRRGLSLRESGLRIRRVLLVPRARWAIPAPPKPPADDELLKLAPREVLDGRHGAAIRNAARDRKAILEIVRRMSKADRALLPEVGSTVDALMDRVAHLARALHELDGSMDWRLLEELQARIAEVERQSGSASPEGARRLALLERQRATLEELVQRRAALARQLDSAGLMLGNLRLDLVKFRSSGLQSVLSEVSNATQEARLLSREIGDALAAVAEVRSL